MRHQKPDDPWEARAQFLRAMAHPLRLHILEALTTRSWCVMDLNSLLPIRQSRLSQHMAALRRAGLVACHIDGPLRCYYLLRPTLVMSIIRLLRRDHPARVRNKASVQREARRAAKPKGPKTSRPKGR